MLAMFFIAGSAWSDITVSDADNYIIEVETDDNGTGTFQVKDGTLSTVTTIESDAQSTTIQTDTAGNRLIINNSGVTVEGGLNNSTHGITNAGAISGVTTINTSGLATLGGSATVGGTLGVTGTISTINGNISTTTGNISTATLSTSGLATLDSADVSNNATVGGTLGVTGNYSTTNGNISTATGNISTATLSTSGAATVGGTLGVTGATNLNNTLAVDSNGATTGGGTLSITDSGLEVTADSNGIVSDGRGSLSVTETEASLTVTNSTGVLHGIVVSETGTTVVGDDYSVISGDSVLSMTDSGLEVNADSNGIAADGAGNLSVTETEASLTLTNKDGNTHGVTINGNETRITGGTTSTSMVLNNSGATFTNTATGGPVRVTGVADGESDYDAVNYSQLKSVEERAYQGIAAVSALAAIPPPIPGKKFSIGVGYGYYEDENAVAVGIKGNLFNRASVGTGVGYAFGGRATVNAGLSFSW